jgi:hypothetical protein
VDKLTWQDIEKRITVAQQVSNDELENRFGFHPANDDVKAKYQEIRAKFLRLAMDVNSLCPESREKALALTALQEAQMWTIGSIAIHETPLIRE